MPTFQDLTGQKFNRLTVMGRVETKGATYWNCRCDCGNEKLVRAGNLKSGQVRSCGCLQKESVTITDMEGQRYEQLVAICRVGTDSLDKATWLFRCDCGNEVVLPGSRVRTGGAKSCGCRRRIPELKASYKHGMQKTLEYKRWESIKQRCTNPNNPSYVNYGGRGISMAPEWIDSFENFFRDTGPRPGPGMSLDRINNDGNYEPGNVRWASHSEQMLNRRPITRATKTEVKRLMKLNDELMAENERLRAALGTNT